jgi:hypothetical protein
MSNPVDLVTPQLVKYCSTKPIIVVCGYTKTGKVTIAKKLAMELSRKVIISDDYQVFGNEDSLQYFMEDVLKCFRNNIPVIIEGILCFRLLRKGLQLNNFTPDLIIRTNCDEDTIKYFYNKEGEGSKINRALSFNKGLDKIWGDYLLLLKSTSMRKPDYLELNTSLKK